jgi:hypothetical protein
MTMDIIGKKRKIQDSVRYQIAGHTIANHFPNVTHLVSAIKKMLDSSLEHSTFVTYDALFRISVIKVQC